MQPRIEGVDPTKALYNYYKKKGVTDQALLHVPELANVLAHKSAIAEVEMDEGERLCYAILGETRKGKSWLIRRISKILANRLDWKIYCKNQEHWWQHYQSEEIVVFNEFDGKYPHYDFKLMVDGDRFIANSKGQSVVANAKVVFICSNIPLDKWYEHLDSNLRDPIIARIKQSWTITDRSQQTQIGKEIMTSVLYLIKPTHLEDVMKDKLARMLATTDQPYPPAQNEPPILLTSPAIEHDLLLSPSASSVDVPVAMPTPPSVPVRDISPTPDYIRSPLTCS